MSTTSSFDINAVRIRKYLHIIGKLDARSAYYRVKAGRELREVRRRLAARQWSSWCARYVGRPVSDLQLLMLLARANETMQARKNQKARHPVAEQPESRAAPLHRAYHDGGAAFLVGVAEVECPYTGRQRHAAWRTGWRDMEARVRITSAG